ncbi:hypothetical protein ADUPG1_000999 [Aduncisulcus paluster]|uniref:Uncharacterized protein n=1 Tax=Aduncisulcus paluster TaxID=2918883 RepID=A0ABQ5KAS5_9EUKA|nr:hypothetical protein ADUPG1_000999 [Aduncisulcus paluster]
MEDPFGEDMFDYLGDVAAISPDHVDVEETVPKASDPKMPEMADVAGALDPFLGSKPSTGIIAPMITPASVISTTMEDSGIIMTPAPISSTMFDSAIGHRVEPDATSAPKVKKESKAAKKRQTIEKKQTVRALKLNLIILAILFGVLFIVIIVAFSYVIIKFKAWPALVGLLGFSETSTTDSISLSSTYLSSGMNRQISKSSLILNGVQTMESTNDTQYVDGILMIGDHKVVHSDMDGIKGGDVHISEDTLTKLTTVTSDPGHSHALYHDKIEEKLVELTDLGLLPFDSIPIESGNEDSTGTWFIRTPTQTDGTIVDEDSLLEYGAKIIPRDSSVSDPEHYVRTLQVDTKNDDTLTILDLSHSDFMTNSAEDVHLSGDQYTTLTQGNDADELHHHSQYVKKSDVKVSTDMDNIFYLDAREDSANPQIIHPSFPEALSSNLYLTAIADDEIDDESVAALSWKPYSPKISTVLDDVQHSVADSLALLDDGYTVRGNTIFLYDDMNGLTGISGQTYQNSAGHINRLIMHCSIAEVTSSGTTLDCDVIEGTLDETSGEIKLFFAASGDISSEAADSMVTVTFDNFSERTIGNLSSVNLYLSETLDENASPFIFYSSSLSIVKGSTETIYMQSVRGEVSNLHPSVETLGTLAPFFTFADDFTSKESYDFDADLDISNSPSFSIGDNGVGIYLNSKGAVYTFTIDGTDWDADMDSLPEAKFASSNIQYVASSTISFTDPLTYTNLSNEDTIVYDASVACGVNFLLSGTSVYTLECMLILNGEYIGNSVYDIELTLEEDTQSANLNVAISQTGQVYVTDASSHSILVWPSFSAMMIGDLPKSYSVSFKPYGVVADSIGGVHIAGIKLEESIDSYYNLYGIYHLHFENANSMDIRPTQIYEASFSSVDGVINYEAIGEVSITMDVMSNRPLFAIMFYSVCIDTTVEPYTNEFETNITVLKMGKTGGYSQIGSNSALQTLDEESLDLQLLYLWYDSSNDEWPANLYSDSTNEYFAFDDTNVELSVSVPSWLAVSPIFFNATADLHLTLSGSLLVKSEEVSAGAMSVSFNPIKSDSYSVVVLNVYANSFMQVSSVSTDNGGSCTYTLSDSVDDLTKIICDGVTPDESGQVIVRVMLSDSSSNTDSALFYRITGWVE